MTETISYAGTLVARACWCGIRFAIPQELQKLARDSGQAVYCPIGHQCVYQESRAEQLERELTAANARAQATRDLLAAEERSHAATKGQLTRTKRRVAAGVCPCCKRTFQQLARHMQTQHPDYAEAKKQ